MKRLACSLTVVLGMAAIATPTQAALFSWEIEYSGWWDAEGGGSVTGSLVADDADAADGIVSGDEITSWAWSWSGNDFAPAFEISSADSAAGTQFVEGFFVDGTPNLPDFLDGLDQGTFFGGEAGEQLIDFEFLLVQADDPFPNGDPEVSAGDFAAETGTIIVSDPTKVPEPTTVLGLLALGAIAGTTIRQGKQA